jgi:long-chain-fatty-acid--CoA ligase ACSBG
VDDGVIQQIMNGQKPGNAVCLIYTSGTTGNPKGVMLSHDNILFNAKTIAAEILKDIPEDVESKVVSYLPLSHIAGLQFDIVQQIIVGSQVFFAQPDALQGTLV